MDEQRAEFETAFPIPDGMVVWSGDKVACREGFETSYRVDRYVGQWAAWQAATQRQQERIAELEAQVQALSLDAGRYRFIRDNCNRRINIEIDNAGMEISDTVEASIDAAIAAGKGEVNG